MFSKPKCGLAPYIGVTGFMDLAEIVEARAAIPTNASRRLMVGVLVSSKTLAGQRNKRPGRYPVVSKIRELLIADLQILNLIHYNTDNHQALYGELVQLVGLAGPHLDGFQLNIAWPPLPQVRRFRDEHPYKRIVLQIGSGAMQQAGSAVQLATRVREYEPWVDAILIDPSGGKGQPLDPIDGAKYLRAIRDQCSPELGIGIAGGLGPETLGLLEPLAEEFPGISIDAEGQLRTLSDALCFKAMRQYLRGAFRLLDGC